MKWIEKFDTKGIVPELISPVNLLYDYDKMNLSRLHVNSERLKYLYNKNNVKKEFIETGFNVPELYHYSKSEFDILGVLDQYEDVVAKPAHLSFSDDIIIKKSGDLDKSKVYELLSTLNRSTNRTEPDMLIQTERGILIEQFIKKVYELKVFVVWGCPIIADLRNENNVRIELIYKDNSYFNWDIEYELIQNFAEKIQVDFFRIDFLYDGEKLYAGECAFMPSTSLPEEIKQFICNEWSNTYSKYYSGKGSNLLDLLKFD